MTYLKCKIRPDGKKGQKYYRIVIAPLKSKRRGKVISLVGYYNISALNVRNFVLNKNKLKEYLKKGVVFNKKIKKYIFEFI